MAKNSGFSIDSNFFLKLSLGVFFLMLGIMGVGRYDSGLSQVARFFGRNDSLAIAVAVAEIVMGVILLLGIVLPVSSNIAKIVGLLIFILWLCVILYYFFFNNFVKPSFVPWFYEISWRAVVLAALWVVGTKANA
jgi:hypothetical protein